MNLSQTTARAAEIDELSDSMPVESAAAFKNFYLAPKRDFAFLCFFSLFPLLDEKWAKMC